MIMTVLIMAIINGQEADPEWFFPSLISMVLCPVPMKLWQMIIEVKCVLSLCFQERLTSGTCVSVNSLSPLGGGGLFAFGFCL